eukprot:366296-Chlamydomonas_euryale.AAC.10
MLVLSMCRGMACAPALPFAGSGKAGAAHCLRVNGGVAKLFRARDRHSGSVTTRKTQEGPPVEHSFSRTSGHRASIVLSTGEVSSQYGFPLAGQDRQSGADCVVVTGQSKRKGPQSPYRSPSRLNSGPAPLYTK